MSLFSTEKWARAGDTSEGRNVQLRGHRLQRFGELSRSDGVCEQRRVRTLGLRSKLYDHLISHQNIDLSNGSGAHIHARVCTSSLPHYLRGRDGGEAEDVHTTLGDIQSASDGFGEDCFDYIGAVVRTDRIQSLMKRKTKQFKSMTE